MPGVTTEPARKKTELPTRWRLDAGDYVSALSLSADGARCVVGTGSGKLLVVSVQDGQVLWTADAHPLGVLGVQFAKSGEALASCGQDPHAKLWSASGALVRTLPGGSTWVEQVAWSPSGEQLATTSGRRVRVWTRDGEPIVETEELPSTATGLAWSSDGKQLAVSCYGGVHVWPVVSGATARHLAWRGSLISLAWSPDGKVLACGSQDNSVHFWRLSTGQDSEMRGYPFKPKALAWDSDSTLLATAGDMTVTVWDFSGKGPEGRPPLELKAHQAVCTCLAFSHRDRVLASGSQDMSILLWEPRRGKKPVKFAFLEDEVTALAWHPRHEGLVGADASGNVSFWDLQRSR